MVSKSFAGIVAALVLAAGSTSALAQGTAITYQGQLKNSGAVVNSATDMQFSLWTLAVGGTQIGSTVTSLAVPVADGLFTAPVDFGVNPYTSSQNLFLQIAVRNPAGSGSYVPMGSRQLLTPSPFSLATRGINVNPAGKVGIGTSSPLAALSVGPGSLANDDLAIQISTAGAGTARFIGLNKNGGYGTVLGYVDSGASGYATIRQVNGDPLRIQVNNGGIDSMSFLNSGNVGVGTNAPQSALHVRGPIQNTNPQPGIHMGMDGGTTGAAILSIVGTSNYASLEFHGDSTQNDFGARLLYNKADGSLSSQGASRFSVNVLEIRGGSDLVEGFDSQAAEVEPGTLMVIDPAHPGQLMPSTSAYDSKVAGIVSGANGVNPGIKMGQDGVMDGKNLIAMTGRVYVKCTSVNGTIKPGDLLTTSDVAGHAMKASDAGKSQGTVVGKAMSSLDAETGMVLVLVNLQ